VGAARRPAGPFEALAPRLRGLGSGRDAEVTARALVDGALARLEGSPRPIILHALRSQDWGAQWGGLLAVARYGPADDDLASGLEAGLTSDVAQVRRTAAQAAAYLDPSGFARIEATLESVAGDPVARVRGPALHTLARRTARRVPLIPLFEAALEDEDDDARTAGAYALAQIELQERLPPSDVARLADRLARMLHDPVTDVVVYAVMALGRAGPQAAGDVPALLTLLDDQRVLVRSQAATALGSIGAPALPAIEAALRDAEGLRIPSLLWALRQIGEPAYPLLVRSLGHPKAVVRVLAAQKLWERDHAVERALDVLIAVLGGTDEDAVRLAARTLARMGTEGARALPALRRRRGHGDEVVRAAVEAAIERLQAQGD